MADDVQDVYIATEAGDAGWQSLTELTASKVEAKLPIESVDGEVVLSDSSGSFVVSTGGVETMRSGSTYFRCSSAAGNYFVAEQTGAYQAIWIGGKGGSGGTGGVGIQTAKVTGEDKDGRSLTIAPGASTGAGLPGSLVFATSNVGTSGSTENELTTRLKIDNQNRVLVNTPQPPGGTPANVLYVNGSAIVSTSVKTPSISGLTSNDASVALGASFVVSTGGEGRVEVSDRFPIRVLNTNGSFYDSTGTSTAGVAVLHNVTGTGITRCSAFDGTLNFSGTTTDLPIYNARNVNFLDGSDVTGIYCGFKVSNLISKGDVQAGYFSEIDAGESRYQFYGQGNAASYFGGNIQAPSISGLLGADTFINFGNQVTLTQANGADYVPSVSNSICTKKYCDDNAGGPAYDDTQIKADLDSEVSARKAADQALQNDINQKAEIWTGTQAEYDALGIYSNYTLYCITD